MAERLQPVKRCLSEQSNYLNYNTRLRRPHGNAFCGGLYIKERPWIGLQPTGQRLTADPPHMESAAYVELCALTQNERI